MHKNKCVSMNLVDIYTIEDEFYMPARKGTRTRMPKIKDESSWKNQSKACNQWAKHKVGVQRGCADRCVDVDNMFRRLAKDGYPVVLS